MDGGRCPGCGPDPQWQVLQSGGVATREPGKVLKVQDTGNLALLAEYAVSLAIRHRWCLSTQSVSAMGQRIPAAGNP